MAAGTFWRTAVQPSVASYGIGQTCVAVPTLSVVDDGVSFELGAWVPGRLKDVGIARDWNLEKLAVEEGVDTGLINMRGVEMAVVSEGGAVVSLRDATEGRAEVPFRDATE